MLRSAFSLRRSVKRRGLHDARLHAARARPIARSRSRYGHAARSADGTAPGRARAVRGSCRPLSDFNREGQAASACCAGSARPCKAAARCLRAGSRRVSARSCSTILTVSRCAGSRPTARTIKRRAIGRTLTDIAARHAGPQHHAPTAAPAATPVYTLCAGVGRRHSAPADCQRRPPGLPRAFARW